MQTITSAMRTAGADTVIGNTQWIRGRGVPRDTGMRTVSTALLAQYGPQAVGAATDGGWSVRPRQITATRDTATTHGPGPGRSMYALVPGGDTDITEGRQSGSAGWRQVWKLQSYEGWLTGQPARMTGRSSRSASLYLSPHVEQNPQCSARAMTSGFETTSRIPTS